MSWPSSEDSWPDCMAAEVDELFDEDPEDVDTRFRQDEDGTTVAVSPGDDDWTRDPQ